jgi:AAA15 family ATPase/GTPase
MIIDFTITNFRSIKDPQVFSLYAETPGTHLLDNIAYPAGEKIGVLKCAGLYGANASGKSNVLKALSALCSLIDNSGELKEHAPIPQYEPFLLSEETKTAPVQFEIEVVISGVRYAYKIAFTQQEIVEESLIFYPSTQPAVIFNRKPGATWKDIKFGSLYKGGARRIPLFSNNAYLSKAGNNAEAPDMIREVYNYFWSHIQYLGLNENIIIEKLYYTEELEKKIASVLAFVDTGIAYFKSEKATEFEKDQFYSTLSDTFPESVRQKIWLFAKRKFMFAHQTDSGTTEFLSEQQESDGTLRLFKLAPVLIDKLERGGILMLDELDHSMHPFMAELIIKLFNDPRVNKNNAQLIFTTHNIHLMTSELLRRDQIWFTEKHQGATRCYSLDEFDKSKVKSTSPFNQWYAEGRFGAVPSINYESIVDLFAEAEERHA